jgi:glucuronokinase
VGNPSDGFGGAVIAATVANFAARVVVYEWPELEILPAQEDRCRFASLSQFVDDVHAHGYEGGLRLVKAAVKRFADHCRQSGAEVDPTFVIRYESSIPRQVGLAGSSAIVMATLLALREFHGHGPADRELPSLALSVETDELGIPGGLQDRVVQAHGGLLFMDFARGPDGEPGGADYERLDPGLLPDLYVAYLGAAAESSAVTHSDLRRRFDAGDPAVRSAMRRLAELAREGREHLVAHDHDGFAQLMDAGFDVRRSVCDLDPRHVRMIEVARSVGAAATFAGSGGAIVGVCDGPEQRAALSRALTREGCIVIEPRVAARG